MFNPFIIDASIQFYKGKYILYNLLFNRLITLLPQYHQEIEECTRHAYALWKFCVMKAPLDSAKHKDHLLPYKLEDFDVFALNKENLGDFLSGIVEVLTLELHGDLKKERIMLVNHIRKVIASIEHLVIKLCGDKSF